MGVNMSIPAAYDECLSQTEQLEWLYKHKENLLTAGANIKITRSGDTVIIAAEGEGFSPTVNVEVIPGGHRVTITDGEGPHVFDVMDGAPGQDGTDGTDGTSVSFSTQTIQGGTRVFLEDGTHSSSFDVMDGTDGEDITITDVSVISAGTQVTFSDDTVIVIPNGLTGPQGVPGTNGRNVFIKYADAQPTQDSDMKDLPSAFMGVYSGTATTAPTTYTDYLWYQIKGTKGDTGSQGPAGVSPSLSAEPISGGHRVSMTDAQGTTTFDVMDGENAAAATVTVGSTTTGEPGTNASVTNSGTSSDAVLDFVIPRGLQGPQGAKGDTGDTGPAGTTPSITVTATADATSSDNPSVTVTKSGTDAAPTFAMAFSGLKGAAGAAGQGVPAGGSGNQVLSKVNATDYNTQWKTIGLIPTGGTSGQVLTKTGSSNYQMSWSTPTGRLPDYPYGALVADETGTAVWLGPNDVDPTTDIGKVLTLKNIAESGMPPQIIPQWESSGGGGGGSDIDEWVDVTTDSNWVGGSIDFYAQNSASSMGTGTVSSYSSHHVFMKPIKVGTSTYHAIKFLGVLECSASQALSNFVRAQIILGSNGGWSYNYKGETYNVRYAGTDCNVLVAPSSFVYQGGTQLSKYTTCGSVYFNTANVIDNGRLQLYLGFPAPTNGSMAFRIYLN